MFEPCYEHCYLRFGKQYTPDCDDKCAYAKAVKERDKAVEFIKYLDKNYSSYMTEDEKFEEWRKMSVNKDYYVIAGYDLTGYETDIFEDWKWTVEGEKFHCYQRKGQVQLFYDPMGDSHLYFGYILAHGDEYECPTGKINVSKIEEVKGEVENKLQELINQGAILEGCKPSISYQILAFEECS